MCNRKYITEIPENKDSKYCSTCKQTRDIEFFSKNRTTKDGYNSHCKSCATIFIKKRYSRIKLEILSYYGDCTCACCGETRIEFLALDHINGGGNIDRKNRIKTGGTQNTYEHLYKLGKPDKEKYRVLCHNCNMSIAMYGYCPHGNIAPLARIGADHKAVVCE